MPICSSPAAISSSLALCFALRKWSVVGYALQRKHLSLVTNLCLTLMIDTVVEGLIWNFGSKKLLKYSMKAMRSSMLHLYALAAESSSPLASWFFWVFCQ